MRSHWTNLGHDGYSHQKIEVSRLERQEDLAMIQRETKKPLAEVEVHPI
jgi:hypothetical protein